MTDQATSELVERRSWEATRDISHEEARNIAKRFIDGHFRNDAERPRMSIPAQPDRDDDLLLHSYINQQERRLLTLEQQLAESGAEVKLWKQRAFDLERRHGDLKGVFVESALTPKPQAQAEER